VGGLRDHTGICDYLRREFRKLAVSSGCTVSSLILLGTPEIQLSPDQKNSCRYTGGSLSTRLKDVPNGQTPGSHQDSEQLIRLFGMSTNHRLLTLSEEWQGIKAV
jgi:hypothetical protein